MSQNALIARFGADTEPFKKGLRDAQGMLGKFEKSIGGLGTKLAGLFAVGTIANFAKSTIDTAANLGILASRVNTNVEAFQALEYSARLAGARQEDIVKALGKVQTASARAAEGNAEFAKSFESLGIDLEEFSKLTPDKQLEALGKAYVNAGMSQQSFATISKLLGEETAPKLNEVLKQLGNEGLGTIEQKARDAGQVISEDTVVKMRELLDQIDIFKRELQSGVAEPLTALVQYLREASLLWKGFGEILGTGVFAVYRFGEAIINIIKTAFEPLTIAVKSQVNNLEALKEAFKGNIGEANKILINNAKTTIDAVKGIPEAFTNAFDNAKKNIEQANKDTQKYWDDTQSRLADIGNDIDKVWTKSTQKVIQAVSTISDGVAEASKEIEKALDVLKKGESERAFDALGDAEKLLELKKQEAELLKQAQAGDAKAATEYNSIIKERMSLEKKIADDRLKGIEEAKKAELDRIDEIVAKEKERFTPTSDDSKRKKDESRKEFRRRKREKEKEEDEFLRDRLSKDEKRIIRTSQFGEAFREQGLPGETRTKFAVRKKLELLEQQAQEAKLKAEGIAPAKAVDGTPIDGLKQTPETQKAEQGKTDTVVTELQKVNELLESLKGALQ